MHLVVGLGNPGARYAKTRHNVGFLVVDELARRWGCAVDRAQFGADVGAGRLPGGQEPVVLCKPQSFMNLSGQPVSSLKGYYKVELPQVVVVHDDVDLPFGDIRVKVGGGHGGHNGLRDLAAAWVTRASSGFASACRVRPRAGTRQTMCWGSGRPRKRPSSTRGSPRPAWRSSK